MSSQETKLPETLAPAQVVAQELQEQETEIRAVKHACVKRLRTESLAYSLSQSVGEYAQMPYVPGPISFPYKTENQGSSQMSCLFKYQKYISSDTKVPLRTMHMGTSNFLPSEEAAFFFFHDSNLSDLLTTWKLESDQARTSCHL